jgi:hypothetical protein
MLRYRELPTHITEVLDLTKSLDRRGVYGPGTPC